MTDIKKIFIELLGSMVDDNPHFPTLIEKVKAANESELHALGETFAKLFETASYYLECHPQRDVMYLTDDLQVFYSVHDAENHATGLHSRKKGTPNVTVVRRQHLPTRNEEQAEKDLEDLMDIAATDNKEIPDPAPITPDPGQETPETEIPAPKPKTKKGTE